MAIPTSFSAKKEPNRMFTPGFYILAVLASSIVPWHSPLPAQGLDGPATAFTGTNPDLEKIRAEVINDLLTPPVDADHIRHLVTSMRSDGSWPDIDYKDVSRRGFDHSIHLENMFELSRAYRKAASPLYQNEKVKKAALAALDFWLKHDFICDNWWWNELGTPSAMINTLLVLDTDLNESQAREGLKIAGRANMEASAARPGGDLIQVAGMLCKQALFRRDETALGRVTHVIADEVKISTGRGLQADMSFHHRVDKVIGTLSYGASYANAFAYWAAKVSGTRYRFPDTAIELLTDYFLDGICKSMVYGRYPDPGAKNRELSRQGALAAADAEVAENLMAISGYRRAELQDIAQIRKGQKQPALSWSRFYWRSEYFTHQRPEYFTSVRMHSSRNHTVEQPYNEEGLKMHHLADGANFISATGEEYFDIFPVWNWQKIPGTTTVQRPELPHWREIAKKGLTAFVGAVTDGRYGAAAFDFESALDPLKARKAWFFFDREYVCLGAGITSTSEYAVHTTINQCLLQGEVSVKTRKDVSALEQGEHALEPVSWIWHNGVGYLFPDAGSVVVSNATAMGSWHAINRHAPASDPPAQKEVFSVWFDHGIKPDNEAYEYIVIPGTTTTALDPYLKDSPLKTLENSKTMQAVSHEKLNRTQVVFYEPGKIRLPENITLTTDSAAMVMVKTDGDNIEQLTVSDPTRSLRDLRLRISSTLEGTGNGWRAEWDPKEKESIIDIELPQGDYAGQSVVLNLSVQ